MLKELTKLGSGELKNLVLKKNYRCRLGVHTYSLVHPQLQSKKANSSQTKPQQDRQTRQKVFSQAGFWQSEVQSHHTIWG